MHDDISTQKMLIVFVLARTLFRRIIPSVFQTMQNSNTYGKRKTEVKRFVKYILEQNLFFKNKMGNKDVHANANVVQNMQIFC